MNKDEQVAVEQIDRDLRDSIIVVWNRSADPRPLIDKMLARHRTLAMAQTANGKTRNKQGKPDAQQVEKA